MVRAADIPFTGNAHGTKDRKFSASDHAYRFHIQPVDIVFELDRVRRSSHELWGELIVKVNGNFPDAHKLQDGVISAGDLNLSSVQARVTRAKLLTQLCGDKDFEFIPLIEDFSIRVIAAERAGSPAVDLRNVPRPRADRWLNLDGIEIPIKHPTVLFGDGGTAKSYFALYWAGLISRLGCPVLYVDWEWTKDEHRERMEMLFGSAFPEVLHLEAYRSLKDERERIQRAIRIHRIQYAIFDSVAVACGGDPSGSEACMLYWQTIRQLGIGTLHIAHVTKGFNGKSDDQKPFGSTFWHNMARATYNVKGEPQGSRTIAVGIYARKNQWGHKTNSAFKLSFSDERTTIEPVDLKAVAGLEEGLPINERIDSVIEEDPKTRNELAQILDLDVGTITRIVYRELKRGRWFELPGKKGHQRIGISPSRTRENEVEF